MPQIVQNETPQGHRGFTQRSLAFHRRRIIRVLIIDDNLADVELCLQELKRAQFAISADVVQTQAEFSDKLGKQAYDVVLADTALHEWTGLQALALLQEQEQETPFILVTKPLEPGIAGRIYEERRVRLRGQGPLGGPAACGGYSRGTNVRGGGTGPRGKRVAALGSALSRSGRKSHLWHLPV